MTLSAFDLNHPSGVQLSRALTEDALLASLPSPASSRRDMLTGCVWYQLPTLQDGEYVMGVALGFNRGSLEIIHIADANPKFGVDWNEWSEKKEQLRANNTESWLMSRGIVVGLHSWGSVWAGFDAKGGHGFATVHSAG
jgi:hypothetical protein